MKKYFSYLLLLSLSVTLFSCNDAVNENFLHGKWKLTGASEDVYENENFVETKERTFDTSAVIEFSRKGTYVSSTLGRGSYTLSEDKTKIVLSTTDWDNRYILHREENGVCYIDLKLRKISKDVIELFFEDYLCYDYPGFDSTGLPTHVEIIYTYTRQ